MLTTASITCSATSAMFSGPRANAGVESAGSDDRGRGERRQQRAGGHAAQIERESRAMDVKAPENERCARHCSASGHGRKRDLRTRRNRRANWGGIADPPDRVVPAAPAMPAAQPRTSQISSDAEHAPRRCRRSAATCSGRLQHARHRPLQRRRERRRTAAPRSRSTRPSATMKSDIMPTATVPRPAATSLARRGRRRRRAAPRRRRRRAACPTDRRNSGRTPNPAAAPCACRCGCRPAS